ncbi:MAG TPA: hypothetical protein VNS99_13670 [Gaiellales bacterium]|nr:hypothetical protein [Gaiellales bacterium]
MSQPSEPDDPSTPSSTSVGEVAPETADPPHDGDLDAPAVPFIGRRGRRRRGIESIFIRFVATGGVIGIGVAAAAIMGTQDIAAWVIGLVVSVLSVVLAAILWSSRTL